MRLDQVGAALMISYPLRRYFFLTPTIIHFANNECVTIETEFGHLVEDHSRNRTHSTSNFLSETSTTNRRIFSKAVFGARCCRNGGSLSEKVMGIQ